jgi:hypothetical protein
MMPNWAKVAPRVSCRQPPHTSGICMRSAPTGQVSSCIGTCAESCQCRNFGSKCYICAVDARLAVSLRNRHPRLTIPPPCLSKARYVFLGKMAFKAAKNERRADGWIRIQAREGEWQHLIAYAMPRARRTCKADSGDRQYVMRATTANNRNSGWVSVLSCFKIQKAIDQGCKQKNGAAMSTCARRHPLDAV